MPSQSDFASRTATRMIQRRATFGTTFRILGTDPDADPVTSKGVEDLMALNDFPTLKLQYEKLNANELNPVVLDCIDPALDIGPGTYLTYPYTGDEEEGVNRMIISALQPVTLSGVEIRRFVLIYNGEPG